MACFLGALGWGGGGSGFETTQGVLFVVFCRTGSRASGCGTPNSSGRAHASWQAKKTSVGWGAARTGWAGRTSDSGAWFSARLISPGFRANHSVEKCVCLNFTGLRKLGKMVPWIWSRARRLLAVRMEMPSPSDGDASGACARGDTRSVHEPCVEPVHAQVLRELDGDLLRPALRRLARLDFHDAGAVVRLVVRRGDAVCGVQVESDRRFRIYVVTHRGRRVCLGRICRATALRR